MTAVGAAVDVKRDVLDLGAAVQVGHLAGVGAAVDVLKRDLVDVAAGINVGHLAHVGAGVDVLKRDLVDVDALVGVGHIANVGAAVDVLKRDVDVAAVLSTLQSQVVSRGEDLFNMASLRS